MALCCVDEEVGLQFTLKAEQDFHIKEGRERGGGTRKAPEPGSVKSTSKVYEK